MIHASTFHIVPSAGGQWSLQTPEAQTLGSYASEVLAIAGVWNLVRSRATTEVIVHTLDGRIDSNIRIQNADALAHLRDQYIDAEDEALSREADRLMPSRSQIRELMARLPASSIDYSREDDELPC